MPRVIYLIALERVFDNAIFDNQVKKLLQRIRRLKDGRVEISLVVLLPWIELTRRGIYSNFQRYKREIDSLRKELAAEGIRLVAVRTLYPSAFFNMRIAGLAWFSLISLPAVLWQILARRADVVHCRYYYAAFVALLAAKFTFGRVKVVFDVRTLLPEQGVVYGIWKEGGPVFRFWKAVERRMFASAARVVSVSPAMTERIRAACPEASLETIPNFVDLETFRPDSEVRGEIRRELGLEERIVLVFSGTLGGRYPAGRMAECVNSFFRIFGKNSFFLLLTSSDEKRRSPLKALLTGAGLEEGKSWRAVNLPPREVPAYLNAADWALLVLGDFLTSETFLPLKFSEYLACGLPILTHPANRELTSQVESYGVGAALDERAAESLPGSREALRRRCLEVAREEFDINRFAARYAAIYAELAGGEESGG